MQQERSTNTKVVEELTRLYKEGDTLKIFILTSGDEMSADKCNEELWAWRNRVRQYIAGNISPGKAHQVDSIPSIKDVSYPGMKSSKTSHEKETIVSHLTARQHKLSELIGDY